MWASLSGTRALLPTSSSTPRPSRPSRDLLTAWLLLLLDGGPAHGYDLGRQLAAQRLSTEACALYRVLKRLEQEGCVASSWSTSAVGPPRQVYRLTSDGRRKLDEIVHLIGALGDAHTAFVRAHSRARRERAEATGSAGEHLR